MAGFVRFRESPVGIGSPSVSRDCVFWLVHRLALWPSTPRVRPSRRRQLCCVRLLIASSCGIIVPHPDNHLARFGEGNKLGILLSPRLDSLFFFAIRTDISHTDGRDFISIDSMPSLCQYARPKPAETATCRRWLAMLAFANPYLDDSASENALHSPDSAERYTFLRWAHSGPDWAVMSADNLPVNQIPTPHQLSHFRESGVFQRYDRGCPLFHYSLA